jgi:hypothetical protein
MPFRVFEEIYLLLILGLRIIFFKKKTKQNICNLIYKNKKKIKFNFAFFTGNF